MTISMKRAAILLSGTIAAGIYGSVSLAADIEATGPLPAVSGPNGKIEIGGGWTDIDELGSDEVFRGGAAFSFPVGDMFGIQADLTALNAYGETALGGALHAFTRDPSSYLLGAYGGYVNAGAANIWYVGPEVELYLDNVSLEAVGGIMDISDGVGTEFYAMGKVALYATDNLRLSVGASTVANFESANAGLEWFMGDTGLPVSFTVDGEVGEDGYTSIQAGLNLYFGGEDKSLIRRHREDDPRLHFFSLLSAGVLGALNANDELPEEPVDEEQECIDEGGDWIPIGDGYCDFAET